ncbi:MAG TPA: porin [Burkholderiales bacterium]|nr:porin [Burkholderiales bacterium]
MNLNRKAMVLAVGAALTAPGAYGQTSDKWEIYGKFYPELTHLSGTGATDAGATVATLAATPVGTSAVINRWEMQVSNTYIGFRGERNIGRGLKAIGQLEQSVPLDEGTVKAGSNTLIPTFGNRDSFVGLAADWGTVRLGNMDTPFKKYGDTLGFLGVSSGNFVTANNITRKIGFGDSSAASFNLRRANAIDFASPTFSGAQVGVQYSIGNPTEAGVGGSTPANAGINPGANRFPRVVSLGVKWEQGPLYLAAATETHFDLFGGSKSAGGGFSNSGTTAANSRDRAVQLTAVYKIGVHSIEADWNAKKYKETGGTGANSFQDYKNNAYAVILDSRWTNQWRTALSYAKATAGSCSLVVNACSTSGLDGNLVAAGVAYSLDPSTYLFGLLARLTNGSSAGFNNTTQNVNTGEDTKQIAFGIAYSF